MNRRFVSKITLYNEWFNNLVNYCIRDLPFEYRFGYTNIATSEDFPTWTKISKVVNINFQNLPITVFGYFAGDRPEISGQYSTLGTVHTEYNYKIDFILPVSNKNNSENWFWTNIEKFLNKLRNYDFRVHAPEHGFQSTLIKPAIADFVSPYIEFANHFCHFASYQITIIDSAPYGEREGVN
ncbi:MAG: hypothetical protein NZM44_00415 [Candidatus Calescibacterium sp.]|nr:hypothetical protein [Candidatus Calescibacterium sp.]